MKLLIVIISYSENPKPKQTFPCHHNVTSTNRISYSGNAKTKQAFQIQVSKSYNVTSENKKPKLFKYHQITKTLLQQIISFLGNVNQNKYSRYHQVSIYEFREILSQSRFFKFHLISKTHHQQIAYYIWKIQKQSKFSK